MVKHHLAYYATQFSTAELNGMFYRTPSFEAVRGWREQTPKDFVFARIAGAPWIATARDVYVAVASRAAITKIIIRKQCCANGRARFPWRRAGRTIHVYFDNGQKSAVPAGAIKLAKLLRS